MFQTNKLLDTAQNRYKKNFDKLLSNGNEVIKKYDELSLHVERKKKTTIDKN